MKLIHQTQTKYSDNQPFAYNRLYNYPSIHEWSTFDLWKFQNMYVDFVWERSRDRSNLAYGNDIFVNDDTHAIIYSIDARIELSFW